MASLIAKDLDLVFPFVGSDKRFRSRLSRVGDGSSASEGTVGGHILVGGKGRVRRSEHGVRALQNINLSLRDGDRLGIHGHNGAGKSTLLRVLAGIYPPTSGTLLINGRTAGMFSLGLGINKEVSGLENIYLKGAMYGLNRVHVQALLPDILEFSELGEYIHMPVKTYSSGMQLRLQFSIASALRPDILLMDEWISTADRTFRDKMDRRLNQMMADTPIVIIASHSEDRLQGWANRVLTMRAGRIVETRDTSDIQAPTGHKPDPELLHRYAVLSNLGQLSRANAMLEQIFPRDADPFTHNMHQTIHAWATKDFAAGERSARAALVQRPEDPKMLNFLGRFLVKQARYESGIEALQQALTLSDGTIGSVGDLRHASEQLGRAEDAEAFLEDLLGRELYALAGSDIQE